MLTTITLAHVGPHTAAAIPLSSLTTISGPSGAGKSTIIDAIGAALAIGDRDGAWMPGQTTSESAVTLRLSDGHRIHWTPASTQIAAPGEKKGTRYATTKALSATLTALGILPAGVSPALIRLAFIPGDWLRACEGDPKALRAFRDTLAPILGDRKAATSEALTEAGLPDWAGPTTEAEIGTALTAARATVERARGAVEAHAATIDAPAVADPGEAPARPAHAALPLWRSCDAARETLTRWEAITIPPAPATPSADLTTALRALQATATAWEDYHATQAAHAAADARTAHIEAWDAARAALGNCPRVGPMPNDPRPLADIDADIEANHAAAKNCHLCPECGQGLPEDTLDVEVARARSLAQRAALNVERHYAAEVHPVLIEEWSAANAAADKWHADLAALGSRPLAPVRPGVFPKPTEPEPSAAAIDAARRAVTAARDAEIARDAALRARGQRPAVPIEPATPRPTAEALAAEAHATAQHAEAATLYRADQAARAIAAREKAAAEARVTDAEASVTDLEAAREAVRTVPGRLAKAAGWLTAIGDTVALTDTGATIRGRSSRRASTGERVHADAVFRSALLTRIGGALPLIIDGAQDWSGDLPAHPGQTLILRTAPTTLAIT